MHSPRQMEELLGMSGWICLNGCIIHLLLMVLFVYLVFYLVIDFLAELVGFQILKIQNSQPLLHWNNAVFTFKKHAGHRLHASTFPILQALLSLISGAAQPTNFRCQTSK